MIDIDEIEEICDVMIDGGFQHCPPAGCGSAEKVKELITRLREAKKDAERYRWLRDKSHTVTGVTPCAFAMKDGDLMEDWNGQYGLLCMGALDAAVDEAVSENQA